MKRESLRPIISMLGGDFREESFTRTYASVT